MARPRAADYDDHRAQILQSAAALFAQRGYSAATMAEVAAACGVSKPTLYHYFQDKQALLLDIVATHVARLEALVAACETQSAAGHDLTGRDAGRDQGRYRLRALIASFMQAYADAQDEHRVLTEDVKFLDPSARHAVLDAQRRVVSGFADAVAACRPDLPVNLHKPLAMLLFGMINWTFTWLQPGGQLTHQSLGPIVADLFFGGVDAVQAPDSPAR
jgi:AcrR family transcriptional regulator